MLIEGTDPFATAKPDARLGCRSQLLGFYKGIGSCCSVEPIDSRIGDRAQFDTGTSCRIGSAIFLALDLILEKCAYFASILMKTAAYIACLVALSLGGCSTLPRAGPTASEVAAAGQAESEVLFDVVDVDDRVVSTLLSQPKESFHARFEKDGNPPELKIAVGDTISVTIWESAAGGLFSAGPAPQLPTGSRPTTEPLAPESPQPPPTETPTQPIPGIDQLLSPPNQPPGAPPEMPFGAPNRPSGAPAERTPSGQPPSGNVRQTGPLSSEAVEPTSESRSATIPDQQVAPSGTISVPYAGQVPAAGRTPAEVQQTIEALLASKALGPQALVIVKKSDANAITVAGEVVPSARVQLSLGGDRLLQVIAAAGGAAGVAAAGGAAGAAAGGITAPLYETFVRLSRNGVTVTIPFERLVADSAEDIYARPGDVLTLVRIPQTFSVFGATGRNDSITFDAERLTLSQALAKSQGLRDDLANPKGVFLFRYELASMVRALGQPLAARASDGVSPVAYRFDFSDANSYLLADQFPVHDKDIIFVADAGAVQVQKLFTLLQTVTGPVITGLLVCRSGNTKC
jgi:polysaccharide export outer membrane protein